MNPGRGQDLHGRCDARYDPCTNAAPIQGTSAGIRVFEVHSVQRTNDAKTTGGPPNSASQPTHGQEAPENPFGPPIP